MGIQHILEKIKKLFPAYIFQEQRRRTIEKHIRQHNLDEVFPPLQSNDTPVDEV